MRERSSMGMISLFFRPRDLRNPLTPLCSLSISLSLPTRTRPHHHVGPDDLEVPDPLHGIRVAGEFFSFSFETRRSKEGRGRNLTLETKLSLSLSFPLSLSRISQVVVVLSGSMEPGFYRGDILFLSSAQKGPPLNSGDIVVFNIGGRGTLL